MQTAADSLKNMTAQQKDLPQPCGLAAADEGWTEAAEPSISIASLPWLRSGVMPLGNGLCTWTIRESMISAVRAREAMHSISITLRETGSPANTEFAEDSSFIKVIGTGFLSSERQRRGERISGVWQA